MTIWQAEGVTLYHGDCLEILPALDESTVDLVMTDPPYGHNNNNNGDLIQRLEAALGRGLPGNGRPIANDGPEANGLFKATLPMVSRLLIPGGCLCCCGGGGGPDPQFARWSLWLDEAIGLDFKQMIVWDKGPMGLGWHYRRSYETILVAQKRGAPCRWYDTSHRIENVLRPGAYGIRKIVPSTKQHPTEKPWQLGAFFIGLHTQPGDLVLDPFMGRGSFAEAAIRAGRRFIGIEIDETWFEMAKARISDILQQQKML